jgi:hypothetical protein
MSLWKQYRSHRIVHAAPIWNIEDTGGRLTVFVKAEDHTIEIFEPTEPGMKGRCQPGDYAIRYDDGYRSVCPKAQFEAGYSEVPA